MSSHNLIREYAAEHGWSETTIIGLLCDYIDNQNSADAKYYRVGLEDFLLEIVDNERAAMGLCTACLHAEHYADSCDHNNCDCEA